MSDKRPKLAEDFGRELVERLVNRMLEGRIKSWRGQWASERANASFHEVESMRFTPEQHALIWQWLSHAIEDSYHTIVDLLFEKIMRGKMKIELCDPDAPEQRIDFNGSVIGMPLGFSADMIERYGVDAGALYQTALSWTPLANERIKNSEIPKSEWLHDLARSQGRCTECGRPPDALRRRCLKCGQAY